MSGDGSRSDATRARTGLRCIRKGEIQRAASSRRGAFVRSQRALHVYSGDSLTDLVSKDLGSARAPAHGKFDRGCSVTLLIAILSAGREHAGSGSFGAHPSFWVGAFMMISAFEIPSITRPNTVYFLSKAGCF